MVTQQLKTFLAVTVLSSLVLVGCNGDDDDDNGVDADTDADVDAGPDVAPDAEPDEPRIRVIHLSPGAPNVDVFVNGAEAPAITDLEFLASTPYIGLPAGSYDFAVAPTGEGLDDAVLTLDDVELEQGQSYTVVAFNTVEEIQSLTLEDNYEDLANGNIRVRAIHVAVGVGEVDIWNIPEEGDPTPLFTDLGFGEASDTADVPAHAYTVGIDVNNDGTPEYVFEIPALPAGTLVNLFAVEDEGVFVVAQRPNGETVRIDPND